MKNLLLVVLLFASPAMAQLTAPTISATAKGPDQINLTWSAASSPGYGYLVEVQSAGDSRYSSFTQFVFTPNASGDASDGNTDPTCAYCYQPPMSGGALPTWVVESQYIDPQDGSAAQAIIFGLKNNTSYSFRVRTYQGYTGPSYSAYSNTASATTLNYTQRFVSTTGNDSHGGTNSTTDAWLTINHGSSTITSGQELIVLAGNYATDVVHLTNNGSSGTGNKVVVEANPGDTVTITSELGGDPAIWMTGSYQVVDGINNTATIAGGNTVIASGDHGVIFGANLDNKNQPGDEILGDHYLIEGNYLHDTGINTSDAGDTVQILCNTGTGSASYNVVQYNHLTRGAHGNSYVLNQTCATAPSFNQYMNNIADGGWGNSFEDIEQSGQTFVNHDLTEGNVCAYVFMHTSTPFKECLTDEGNYDTMRRNVDMIGGATHGMEINSLHGTVTGGLHYNNVFYEIAERCYWFGNSTGGTYTSQTVANSICTKGGTTTDPDYSTTGVLESFFSTSSTSNITHNDMLYYSAGVPQPNQTIVAYDEGTTLRTVTYADANFDPPFSSNAALDVDPQYVSEPGFDFHLKSTSPLVGAGTSITDATWGTISNTNLGPFDGSFTSGGGSSASSIGGASKIGGKAVIQ